MTTHRGFFPSLLYAVLRLTPAAASLLVLDLSSLAPEEFSLQVNRVLRLLVVLLVWSMTEGVSMLWIREKNLKSPNARGYGAVTLIGAFVVLAFLQVFRSQSSQNQFLLLLTALGLRGMTRAGWEQGRPHLAIITAILAHSLVAGLSFLLALGDIPWPALIVSTALGTLLGAVEATWNGSSFQSVTRPWIMPLHRVTLIYGPVAIGMLSLVSALPRAYAVVIALLIPGLRLVRAIASEQTISAHRFLLVAGLYSAFMAIMAACRAYS
jgi:hypothetical protein